MITEADLSTRLKALKGGAATPAPPPGTATPAPASASTPTSAPAPAGSEADITQRLQALKSSSPNPVALYDQNNGLATADLPRFRRPGDARPITRRDLGPMDTAAWAGADLGTAMKNQAVKTGQSLISNIPRAAAQTAAVMGFGAPVAPFLSKNFSPVEDIKGVGRSLASIPQTFADFVSGARDADSEKMGASAAKFVFEDLPALAATSGPVEGAVRSTGLRLADLGKPEAAATLMRTVPGMDIHLEKLQKGMGELKRGEALTGKPIKDVDSAVAASKAAQDTLHRTVDKVVEPQKNTIVPGSKARLIQSQIDALSNDFKETDPKGYARRVAKIQAGYPKGDLTVGELNDMRKDLSATQSPYYGKDIQGQLVMDSSTRAIDIARYEVARDLLYNTVQGSDVLREANSRIGALIDMQDYLTKVRNKAYVQSSRSMISRGAEKAAQLMSPSKTAETFSKGESTSINADIASAMRRWKPSTQLTVPPIVTGIHIQNPAVARPVPKGITAPTPPPQVSGIPNRLALPPEGGTSGYGMVRPESVLRSSGEIYSAPESPLTKDARFNRALTSGQKLLPESASVKVTPPPPESFAESLARTESPQSKRMRETLSEGPYDKQTRPATAEEYLSTKAGTRMPSESTATREAINRTQVRSTGTTNEPTSSLRSQTDFTKARMPQPPTPPSTRASAFAKTSKAAPPLPSELESLGLGSTGAERLRNILRDEQTSHGTLTAKGVEAMRELLRQQLESKKKGAERLSRVQAPIPPKMPR